MDPTSGIDAMALSEPPVSLISQLPGGLVHFCGDAGLSEISSQLLLFRQERLLP
jgi:hypothetical protein